MEKKLINGLNEHQVFHLYEYLVAYEESGIQDYKSTKELLITYPELSKIKEYNKKVDIKSSKNINLNTIDFRKFSNKIYLTLNKSNLLLSFLSHLRNAIAHGNAVMDDNYILISDRNPRKSIEFTARGRITLDIINEITSILTSIEL